MSRGRGEGCMLREEEKTMTTREVSGLHGERIGSRSLYIPNKINFPIRSIIQLNRLFLV